MMKERQQIVFPRQLLLIEIDRHCFFPDCKARASVGLTKAEARDYRGFKCLQCQRWNDDFLTQSDVPDWWAEIQL